MHLSSQIEAMIDLIGVVAILKIVPLCTPFSKSGSNGSFCTDFRASTIAKLNVNNSNFP
jgi:hypothetical protein